MASRSVRPLAPRPPARRAAAPPAPPSWRQAWRCWRLWEWACTSMRHSRCEVAGRPRACWRLLQAAAQLHAAQPAAATTRFPRPARCPFCPRRLQPGGRLLTPQQLAQYDGRGGRRLYLAVMGSVYDVTAGAKHYGAWRLPLSSRKQGRWGLREGHGACAHAACCRQTVAVRLRLRPAPQAPAAATASSAGGTPRGPT